MLTKPATLHPQAARHLSEIHRAGRASPPVAQFFFEHDRNISNESACCRREPDVSCHFPDQSLARPTELRSSEKRFNECFAVEHLQVADALSDADVLYGYLELV